VVTYTLQELVTQYGEKVLYDSQEAAADILGKHDMAVLEAEDVPGVLEFLCQGGQGDWMIILSKKCTRFPVMELSTCYDLGDCSLLLGS
jgi:hypothetical protein